MNSRVNRPLGSRSSLPRRSSAGGIDDHHAVRCAGHGQAAHAANAAAGSAGKGIVATGIDHQQAELGSALADARHDVSIEFDSLVRQRGGVGERADVDGQQVVVAAFLNAMAGKEKGTDATIGDPLHELTDGGLHAALIDIKLFDDLETKRTEFPRHGPGITDGIVESIDVLIGIVSHHQGNTALLHGHGNGARRGRGGLGVREGHTDEEGQHRYNRPARQEGGKKGVRHVWQLHFGRCEVERRQADATDSAARPGAAFGAELRARWNPRSTCAHTRDAKALAAVGAELRTVRFCSAGRTDELPTSRWLSV